jgi:hypothetical protein
MIELDGIKLGHTIPCSGLLSCFSSKVDPYIFYKLYLSKTHLYKRYCEDETYEVGKITRFIKTDHEYLLWIDNAPLNLPMLKVKIYDTEIYFKYYTRRESYNGFFIKDQNNKILKSMNDAYTIYHSDDVVTA